MSILGSVLGNLGGKVVEALDSRGQRKHEQKVQALELEKLRHSKQIELIQQGQQMDNAWELEQIKNSGWKDEFVLLVISTPLIMAFIPNMQPYVSAGFEALEKTPEYYRWLTLCVFAAIYGIRIWRRK
jgi:hypothetical protein